MLCWRQLNTRWAAGVHVETGMGRGSLVIFRGLPPFLRFTTLMGVLCLLTSLVLLGWMAVTAHIPAFAAGGDLSHTHLLAMAMSLLALGLAFSFLSIAYRSHEHSPDAIGVPVRSWQEQARITALLTALPLWAFVLALVPADPFPVISSLVSAVAGGVNLWAYAWIASWQ
jgi:hypothetical protein